jgi:hypothetical protein
MASRLLIPDSVEWSGEWFLPSSGNDSPRIAGTLSWRERRVTLALHDAFTKMRGVIYGTEQYDYAAIHGVTTKSDLVSVLNASHAGSGFNFGPGGVREPERVVSSWLVVGAHVTPETTYSELRVRIPGLEKWIGRSGVSQSWIMKADDRPASMHYAINVLAEELIPVPDVGLTLGWSFDHEFGGDLLSRIDVETSTCLAVKPDSPQTLEWLIKELGKALTLLAFVAGSPMAPDHITVKLPGHTQPLHVLVALREAKPCTFTRAFDFFMLRGDMQADLGDVLTRWYGLYDRVAMPSQLALSVFSSKELWLHVEFLSLMQALEGLHRALMDGLYTSEEEYKEIARSLTSAIPAQVEADHKDALKSRIKYGNEVSLRKRLDALASRVGLPIRQIVLGADGTVPRSWIDTRNYYTHWDEASRSNTLDGLGMHRACVRMRVFLRVLYLHLVGIPETAIEKSLQNASDESQYLIQLNAAAHREANPGSEAGAIMMIRVDDAPNGGAP